ncbi:hypothetical protein MM239_15830 [Belliella sp. DSM 111904]|uniref:Uncharacterized protein n=1 Tax=Belliella filtrata TaxID=2923435 RepID=A0ABS9V3C1_9BACT|nr:hypothetical protein [Belliella filtrata]MCH7410878.1 hypothetical protein [Belliella filtrata]
MTKLFQKAFAIILFFTVFISVSSNNAKAQTEDIELEYSLLRAIYDNEDDLIRQNTLSKEEMDFFYNEYFNYSFINEFNRYKNALDPSAYVDFDTLLTSDQKQEFIRKLEHPIKVDLDPVRIIPPIISESAIEERKNELQGREMLIFTLISYPIIQKGKNGEVYGIVFETGNIFPEWHDIFIKGTVRIFKLEEDNWKFFATVNCWL